MVVDGERFLVTQREGFADTFDYTWISGRNPGYGFTSAGWGTAGRDNACHVAHIRAFLSGIDPTTGYLGDDVGDATQD